MSFLKSFKKKKLKRDNQNCKKKMADNGAIYVDYGQFSSKGTLPANLSNGPGFDHPGKQSLIGNEVLLKRYSIRGIVKEDS